MGRRRAQAKRNIPDSERPGAKWLSEYGRAELENLVCESTLGGCGHTFHMHHSTTVESGPMAGKDIVFCSLCNTHADRAIEARVRELAKRNERISASEFIHLRTINSCHEFVTGVVTHVDFEKLFRDIERGVDAFGERKSNPRIDRDARKAARQTALDALKRERTSNPQQDTNSQQEAEE